MIDPLNQDAKAKQADVKKKIQEVEQYQKAGFRVDSRSGRSFDPSMYSAIALLGQAREAFKANDYETALKLVEQVLAREKNFADAQQLRAHIFEAVKFRSFIEESAALENQGKFEQAIKEISIILDTSPNEGKFLFWRGRLQIKAGHFKEAWQDLLLARKNGHPFGDIRFYLVEALIGKGQFHEAFSLASSHAQFKEQKDTQFLIWLYARAFPFSCSLFVAAILTTLFGCWWLLQGITALLDQRPYSLLPRTFLFFLKSILLGSNRNYKSMRNLADGWALPWFQYLAGVASILEEKWDLAEKFFQFAIAGKAVAPRTLFFWLCSKETEPPEPRKGSGIGHTTYAQGCSGSLAPSFFPEIGK